MNFIPLGPRVLIERLEDVSKTESGILIPDNVESKNKPLRGKIVAISKSFQDKMNEKETVFFTEGDEVLFHEYKSDEIKIDGKKYLVVLAEELLGVIKCDNAQCCKK